MLIPILLAFCNVGTMLPTQNYIIEEYKNESSFNIDDFNEKIDNIKISIEGINETAQNNIEENTGYIFLGDSRFVGMDMYMNITNEKTFLVAKVSMGYDWLVSDAYNQILEIKANNSNISKWKIITNLGVNDIGNLSKYIDFYSTHFSNEELEIVSINPIEYNEWITNDSIINFNSKLQLFTSENNIKYIDSYNYLIENGYSTVDGIHFNKDTYNKIYNYIIDNK